MSMLRGAVDLTPMLPYISAEMARYHPIAI